MNNWQQWLPLTLLLLLLAACTNPTDPIPTAPPNEPDVTNDVPSLATAVSTPTPPAVTDTPKPTPIVEETAVSPPSPVIYEQLSRAPVTAVEQTTFAQLEANYPPERDDLALAVAYRGVVELPSDTLPAAKPYIIGDREPIFISNIDLNTISSPDFVLLYISNYAYFWFDTTPGLEQPNSSTLAATGEAFDTIYEQNRRTFGAEDNPGIDGDPRIHIVNASPLSVCDVTESTAQYCGLGGYFGASDILPQSVDPTSNEREMFVMNGSFFGNGSYLDILAHEFRHMIESRYDANDWDWQVEGSAMLAEDLLGFSSDAIARGNMFLGNPDQQLNRWVDGNTLPYYGQGYLMSRYIYNRLGEKLYLQFATHSDPGFAAIDALAAENSLSFDGMSLWLDWLAALAIHSDANAPAIYTLPDGLQTAASSDILNFPTTIDTTVNQYAADYYQFLGNGSATLRFTGSNHVPLLPVLPPSGQQMWLANRANYSNMRLTREFDLTEVSSASLQYAVFHDIEIGYDFAYVSVSSDGGQTWQGLTGKNMQGNAPDDDPSDVAYTDRFYTGQSGEWVQETADLTPYAGQIIQIRFEYVTDPILTFGGIAFDDIAVPEIGFFDDAESDAGWLAEGFVRATGYVPQRWHLILITYENGAPVVTPIELTADNTATVEFSLNNDGGGRPLLIIAASSPMTLEPAYYQFDITQ